MKIRALTPENYPKVIALLRQAFPGSSYEVQLVEGLHHHGRTVHEWVGIHINRVIAYIAFTKAYEGADVCGLHLAPLAVKPEFQRQGIGAEMLRFALRQEAIKASTVFVLGDPGFYQRFGFTPCATPLCPFAKDNAHFLSIRNTTSLPFTVGYEAEFTPEKKQGAKPQGGKPQGGKKQGRKRRSRR